MAKLSLVVTRGLRSRELEKSLKALSRHVEVDGPRWLHRASASPTLTEYIELIGSAAAWLPLAGVATVYFSTLARHAGEATWEGLRSLFKSKEVKPLADVADALASSANQAKTNVQIVVGVKESDEDPGISVTIQGGEPEEIAWKMAAFIVRAEGLSRMMRAEADAGRTPLAEAKVEVEKDGSLTVTWYSPENGKTHKRRMN